MPIYLYRCKRQHITTFEQSIHAANIPESIPCEICLREAHRIFSSPWLKFTGEGTGVGHIYRRDLRPSD